MIELEPNMLNVKKLVVSIVHKLYLFGKHQIFQQIVPGNSIILGYHTQIQNTGPPQKY